MSTTTKTNKLIGLELRLLTGVLELCPKLIEYLRQDMEKNYFMDVVFKGIEDEDRLTSIAADPEALTDIQFALFENGIPFERIRVSDHYAGLFHSGSGYVVLTRGSDHEKVLPILERYKAEHELLEEVDEHELPESGDNDEEDPEKDPAEEEPLEEELFDEDDGEELAIDERKPKQHRSDKARRHRERPDLPGPSGHRHTGKEHADATVSPFEDGEEKTEGLLRGDSPEERQERDDRLRSGSNDRSVFRELREEDKSDTDPQPALERQIPEPFGKADSDGKRVAAERRIPPVSEPEAGVRSVGKAREPAAETLHPASERAGTAGTDALRPVAPEEKTADGKGKKAPAAETSVGISFNNGRDTAGTIRVGTTDIVHRTENRNEASVRLDSILGAEDRTGHSLLEKREERPYSLGTAISAAKPGNIMRAAGGLFSEAALPRETEAGRFSHRVLDVASPATAYLADRFMSQAAVSVNAQIHFNKELYLEAVAAVRHISPDAAAVYTEKAIQSFRETEGVSFLNMAQLNDLAGTGKIPGFSGMIRDMSKEEFIGFLDRAGISHKLWQELLKTPRAYLMDPGFLQKLEAAAETKRDLEFLAMLKGSVLDMRFSGSPVGSAVKALSRRLAFSALGNSEGSRGLNSATGILSVMKTGYKTGMKAVTGISQRAFGAGSGITQTARILQSPVRNAMRHTFKTVTAKGSSGAAGGMIRTKTVASRVVSFQSRITSRVLGMKAGADGVSAAAGNTAAGVASGSAAAGGAATAGTAAGGAAAGGATLSGGWIAAIVIVLVILLMSILSNVRSTDRGDVSMKPFNYADRTEIVAEVVSELDQMNTEFNRQINDAANHRGTYAGVISYRADSSATEYESYRVVFRDAYGNELDPKTVDLNNSKAIVSMASQYIPFPFVKPSDNATQAEKEKYEGIKQYFKDYCVMLWAATHRIDIEEYYPGDSAHGDGSGMVTDRGVCDADGSTVWMPEDMVPDFAPGKECSDCTEDFNTGRGDSGHALCSHPGETYAGTDGWKKTGRVSYHYNCAGHEITHEESWTDKDGKPHMETWEETVYCSEKEMYDPKHRHASYEWSYVCGGHMSAVVYVTIGDVSRLAGMDAAGDVDYGAVGRFAGEAER